MSRPVSRLLGILALAGCSVINAVPPIDDEVLNCGDGIDNDLDGNPDCSDDECRANCPDVGALEFVHAPTCPVGWSTGSISVGDDIGDEGWTFHHCELLTVACADGEVLLPDGCTELPLACETAPGDGEIWVGPGGAATIAEGIALAQSTETSVVRLAEGDYIESVALPDGITLAGACAQTLLRGMVTLGTARLLNLRVQVDAGPAVVLAPGANAEISNVALDGGGIEATMGGSLTVTSLRIHGVTGVGAVGLHVAGGASVSLDHSAVQGVAGPHVLAEGNDTALHLAWTTLDDGEGVRVASDAEAHLVDVAMTSIRGIALDIDVDDACGRDLSLACFSALRVAIAEVTPLEGEVAHGILTRSGLIDLEEVSVDRVDGIGFGVEGGNVSLVHSVASRTGTYHANGRALVVTGGQLAALRFASLRSTQSGIELLGGVTQLRQIAVVQQAYDTFSGRGILVGGTARGAIYRFLVDRAGLCGLDLRTTAVGVTRGFISRAQRGVCLAPDTHVFGVLASTITFVENGTDVWQD